MANHYTCSEEFRLEHRANIRRKLAELQVTRERMEELDAVIKAIEADSDEAAAEHARVVEPLQDELARLDASRIDAILVGVASDKSITDRRIEILTKIAEENAKLERHCQANAVTIDAKRKEHNKLSIELAGEQSLRNELRQYASPRLRARSAALQLIDRSLQLAISEARRCIGVYEANLSPKRTEEGTKRHIVNQSKLLEMQAAADIIGDECARVMKMLHENSLAMDSEQ